MSNAPALHTGTTVSPEPSIPLEYKIILAAGYAYAGLVAIGSLWWPFGVDQGIFGWMADVIRGGGTPPVATWEQKGPVAHYVYALVNIVFGRNEWGIRLFDILFISGSAVFLGRTIRKSLGLLAALIIALLFVLSYYEMGFWHTAQPDAWAGILCLCVLIPSALQKKTGTFELLAFGAAIGVASQCKILFILYIAPALLMEAIRSEYTLPQRAANAAKLLAGCAGVILAILLWYSMHGALMEYIEIQFGFNPSVHRLSGAFSPIRQIEFLYEYHYFTLNILVPLALLGFLALFQRNRRLAMMFLSIGVVAMFAVVFQGKYWRYHWTMYWFNAIIAAGLGFCALRERLMAGIPEDKTLLARRIWLAILLLMTVYHTGIRTKQPLYWWAQLVTGRITTQTFKTNFDAQTTKGFYTDIVRAVDYVQRHSSPKDKVQIWGYFTVINYLADRQPPTRFGFHYPLIAGGNSRYKTAYRKEFMTQIENDPPLLIVAAKKDSSKLLPKDSDVYLTEFPAFAHFLATRYEIDTCAERYNIWHRRDSLSRPDTIPTSSRR